MKIPTLLQAPLVAMAFLSMSCHTAMNKYFIKEPVPTNSSIGIFVEGDSQFRNAIFAEFLRAGYDVRALGAVEPATALESPDAPQPKKAPVQEAKNSPKQVLAVDRALENVHKLHLFSLENLKLDQLQVLQKKLGIRYLVLLSLSRWDTGNCWARAIKLDTMQLVYVHNYEPARHDDLKSVLGMMIRTMQSGK
ncbi:MAG: hypothetical protein N2Z22_10810 [Turneriella sp.]|nr:hypothetical protein [Turneriella sp.]